MKKLVLIIVGVALLIAFLIGGSWLVYRARRIFLEAESSRKIPDELKDARVALGSDRFAKEALSIQGDLGEITDFEQSRNGELMVVGQNGVVFLNNGNSFQRSFHFQKKCNSPISNKLVASDKDFIYVLATDGKTLAPPPRSGECNPGPA